MREEGRRDGFEPSVASCVAPRHDYMTNVTKYFIYPINSI